MTKREKILLYVLVYILIIVGGGFLLCMPALEKYNDLKAKYTTIETQWMSTKAGIIEYEDLDAKIEAATKDYNTAIDRFYIADLTRTEDVDQLITSLAVNYYLKPMSLQVSEVSEEEVVNYEEYIQELAKAQTKDAQATTEENATEKTKAKVYNVTLTVTGTISNLQAMVNDANTIKTLKVSEVTYSSQLLLSNTMTVTFKVFMV
ncbi:hypothetical protein [Amedibacillus sp. YH-ame10]